MKLRFKHKRQESSAIWSFFFEPLELLEWRAGQSIRLEIPRKTWGVGERRFTIASAPHEQHLQITTRLSQSEFKQDLMSLEAGSVIQGFNIEGTFTWDKTPGRTLFLAAGIGITPFRALLAEAVQNTAPFDITLWYQSRDTPPVFLDELETWARDHAGLTLHLTSERLTLPDDIEQSLVYISGPEQMVQDLSARAAAAGLPPAQLKTDLFTGSV